MRFNLNLIIVKPLRYGLTFIHVFSNADLMLNVPWSFKLHILLGFTVFACWPFTRLVHVWSVPLSYMNRRYIVYRKNKI